MDPEIDKLFTIAASLIGYPKEALLFVIRGSSTLQGTHIDGETLCWRLHDYALHLYGQNARQQLNDWGIRATSDFGNIVFGLVEHEFLRAEETDRIEDFENVFEFEDQFVEPKHAIKRRIPQWELSTLFVITTFLAIGASGFSRMGVDGIWPALISSWFAFLGISCIVISFTVRSSEGLFLLLFGIVSFVAGALTFATLSF